MFDLSPAALLVDVVRKFAKFFLVEVVKLLGWACLEMPRELKAVDTMESYPVRVVEQVNELDTVVIADLISDDVDHHILGCAFEIKGEFLDVLFLEPVKPSRHVPEENDDNQHNVGHSALGGCDEGCDELKRVAVELITSKVVALKVIVVSELLGHAGAFVAVGAEVEVVPAVLARDALELPETEAHLAAWEE